MKTEDFQVSWYPGVVQYVHKIYQTAADIPKKVKKTCSESVIPVLKSPSSDNMSHIFVSRNLAVQIGARSVRQSSYLYFRADLNS